MGWFYVRALPNIWPCCSPTWLERSRCKVGDGLAEFLSGLPLATRQEMKAEVVPCVVPPKTPNN
eukprot:149913-Amphidinium_carterae.1